MRGQSHQELIIHTHREIIDLLFDYTDTKQLIMEWLTQAALQVIVQNTAVHEIVH